VAFLTNIERVQRERPGTGWLITAVRIILPIIACLGVAFLFHLKNHSSVVRDDFEKPPGVTDYFIFALALLACGVLFFTGLFLIWVRVRRYVAAR